jgi:hypothetical protein
MRSSLDGEARGQFDDVLSVQLARARFAILQIQAAEKSIQAPIAIPQDVQELPLAQTLLCVHLTQQVSVVYH